MKIKVQYATKNPCFKKAINIVPEGLMLHSIGVPQPSAGVMAKTWDKSDAGTAVQAVLQEDGTVIQLLPWNYRGWHCGSGPKGSGNSTHIGIEMTEPNTIRYTGGASWKDGDPKKTEKFVRGTYKTAVELFAKLCKDYNLDPLKDGVIISHSEGCKRGIASNHGDVEHIWSKFGLSMKGFRKDIAEKMGKTDSSNKPTNTSTSKDDGSFLVQITTNSLNIRESATAKSKKVGSVCKGEVYTIVDTTGNWGKLKSGAGYISLNYTKKI